LKFFAENVIKFSRDKKTEKKSSTAIRLVKWNTSVNIYKNFDMNEQWLAEGDSADEDNLNKF